MYVHVCSILASTYNTKTYSSTAQLKTHLSRSGTTRAGLGFCAMASSSDMPGHSTVRCAADAAISRPAMLNESPPPAAGASAGAAADVDADAPALARRALKSNPPPPPAGAAGAAAGAGADGADGTGAATDGANGSGAGAASEGLL